MLKETFCSSPWFHLRINPAGYYLPCRWGSKTATSDNHISTTGIQEYLNSSTMRSLRQDMLNGQSVEMCSACYYEDSNSKVSGRQRQLLKSAVSVVNFDKTFCASPHYTLFEESNKQDGFTSYYPVDLQIDLGNTCNSACIMCSPVYSSKLAAEYPELIAQEPLMFNHYPKFKNWADDPELVDKFVNELANIPNIRYIHFLGGETLYLKSFYTICDRLIATGLAKEISIGTTTNCTVYTPELEHIIREFKHVHLGLSIESFNPINDYIRWPSSINTVTNNINRFIKLREETGMHLSLRITPNVFSIYHLDTVFRFMLDNNIIAESCDILNEPKCLRIELLPAELIKQILTKFDSVINEYNLVPSNDTIVNRRRDDLVPAVISDVIFEYQRFVQSFNQVDDVEEQRINLVRYIKAFEKTHNNSILDYLPEYEEFLRIYNY